MLTLSAFLVDKISQSWMTLLDKETGVQNGWKIKRTLMMNTDQRRLSHTFTSMTYQSSKSAFWIKKYKRYWKVLNKFVSGRLKIFFVKSTTLLQKDFTKDLPHQKLPG